jgi:hypothetical protein
MTTGLDLVLGRLGLAAGVIRDCDPSLSRLSGYADLVGSVGVLAPGWGCRWWAGRDKPKLVEASNPRRRWPRDPDALEEPRSVRCAIEPKTETCLPRNGGPLPGLGERPVVS